jgi:hypothetical protein
VRGAIRTLEEIGFLDRAVASGSTHKRTAAGELHRKPVLFMFGSDYASAFIAANMRAAAARERRSWGSGSMTPERRSTARPEPRLLKSPKSISEADKKVIMGEIRSRLPEPRSLNPQLEAALER